MKSTVRIGTVLKKVLRDVLFKEVIMTNYSETEVVATGRMKAAAVRGLQITLSMFGPKEALHVQWSEMDAEGFVHIVLINISPYYIKHIREVFRAHMREKGIFREEYCEILTIIK